jgi:uncharacterized protein YndB with AHSA1/START domain
MMTELSLTTTRVIRAPVEKVFNAWLETETLKKFMVPCEGGSVPVAETDAREGGRFKVIMSTGEKDIPHAGTYLDIEPHSKIVFTWESPFSVDGSTVTLLFKPIDAGETELTLTQVKFADEGSRDGHLGGWTYILNMLAEASL